MTTDLETMMGHFKRGVARCDRSELARAVTDDFEWHVHWQEGPGDQPTGKILRGLDQVMAEVERRRDNWTELRYDDMRERYLDDMVVQTFVVSGVDEHGHRFSSAAVDLYPVRDGRLAGKQTYWKQFPPHHD
jgi:ketosteroid isomerase-like protein